MSKHTGTKFFVSRQFYWGVDEDESYVVEVAVGGVNYAGSDMLSPRWKHLGEGQEFQSPIDAAQAAIDVCKAWRASGQDNCNVAYGFTGGGTCPFEPCTFDELMKWAEKKFETLPKCSQCGELMGKESFTHNDAFGDEHFCSENCAEQNYNWLQEQNNDDVLELEDEGV